MSRRNNLIMLLYSGMIFLIMFVFFTNIHPLVLFDGDDWVYISYARRAVPLWGNWNPTRVFPEFFMPLCGSFAAYFIYPLTGNYITSITLVNGAAVSFFIAAYLFFVGKLLCQKLRLSLGKALILSTFFLLLHFLVFRSAESGNKHMFYSYDVTYYYFYTISNLLNSCLVLYLMVDDILDDAWNKLQSNVYNQHIVKHGFLLLLIYLALCSNLYASVIMAAFLGVQLVIELGNLLAGKIPLKASVQKNCLRLFYMLCWMAVQIYEVNGGRAYELNKTDSLFSLLKGTLRTFLNLRYSVNKFFMLLTAVIVLSAAVHWVYARRNPSRADTLGAKQTASAVLTAAGAGILIFFYLILVCSQHGEARIMQPDILFGLAFYGFVIVLYCVDWLVKSIPKTAIVLPLLICIVFSEIDTSGRTFHEAVITDTDHITCIAIAEDIVDQFIQADAEGSSEMQLFLPVFPYDSGWPFWGGEGAGNVVAKTLYKHGVISKQIVVTEAVRTREKNDEFHLPYPE